MCARLEKVLNSNEEFLLAGRLRVKFTVIKMPVGYGVKRISRRVQKTMPFDVFCRTKRSVINIRNNDNLCLARAIVVSVANINDDRAHFIRIKNDTRPYQTEQARALCTAAGVDLSNGGGLDEIRKF